MKVGFSVLIFLCFFVGFSQGNSKWQLPPQNKEQLMTVDDQKNLLASENETQWFKDAKFGIFVHWGPALLETNILSWGRHGERPGAGKPSTGGVPPEIYDNLYKQFNPVNFNAEKWMQQIISFGANYLVFTAKHHDGFCMFDAPNTAYDIEHTPFKRDIAKEIADAAHKYNVKLFWYYSQPDWTHPDCLREGKHYESYLPYMKEQLKHLYSQYGKIDGVWFDGLGSKYWNWDVKTLLPELKELQPNLLINPRYGFGLPDMSLRGDYDTFEQRVGPIDYDRYWEACITLSDVWLYHKNGPIKSTENVLMLLIQNVGNGGNLLLNLGPNGEGEFVKEEVESVTGVGEWLKKYGNTIYGTRKGIYIPGDWGVSTQKGDTIYLHFIKKLAAGVSAKFTLPKLDTNIKSVKGITAGFQKFEILNNEVNFYFDSDLYNQQIDNIVEIVLENTSKIKKRVPTWEAKALTTEHFSISVSSESSEKNAAKVIFERKENVFSEGIHVKSYWEPLPTDTIPSVEINFYSPKNIKTVYLSEQIRTHSIENFTLESLVDGKWIEVYEGKYMGNGLQIELSKSLIEGIRLTIKKSNRNIRISAIDLYE